MKIRVGITALLTVSVLMLSGCSLFGDSSSDTDKASSGSASGSPLVPDVQNINDDNETFEIEDFKITLPKDMKEADDSLVQDFFGDMSDVERIGIGVKCGAYQNDDLIFIYCISDYEGVIEGGGIEGTEYTVVQSLASEVNMKETTIITDQGVNYLEYDDEPEGDQARHYKSVFKADGLKLYSLVAATKLDEWENLSQSVNNYLSSFAVTHDAEPAAT